MRQKVFNSLDSFSDIAAVRHEVDRVVLRGQAIHQFYSQVSPLWEGGTLEVLECDIEEIQGTVCDQCVRSTSSLGIAGGFVWEFIRKEP